MFFTAPMRYLQMVILEKDFQKAIDLLADYGWIEIKRGDEEKLEKFSEINKLIGQIEGKIFELTTFFNIEKSEEKGRLLDVNEIDRYLTMLLDKIKPFEEEINDLKNKKAALENGLKELDTYKKLKITKKELDNLNFLFFKIGSMTQRDLEKLDEGMSGRLIYTELSKDFYILFTSKKGRWTLESELKKINFKEKNIPFEDDVLPAEIFLNLKNEINDIEKKISDIENFKNDLLKREKKSLVKIIESFNLQRIYQNIYQSINHSGSTSIIEGWVLKRDLSKVVKSIHSLLGNRVSLVSYNPEELDEVKNGSLKVPVLMENSIIFKPFEDLVFNYGSPVYGAVDPTIFVAISFLILFGFMFGDVGQGLVILLIGSLIKIVKGKKEEKLNNLATIFQYAGTSAMIFGYIYGSFFCFEHLPFFSVINKTLFGINVPYILNTSFHDVRNIFNIVFITIGVGLLINLLGIFLNIFNNFLHERHHEALFSRNGIAGFVLLLSIFLIYIEIVFSLYLKVIPINTELVKILIHIILGSIGLILLKEPLFNILTNHRPVLHDSIGMWILHSLVELIEVVLVTMSNNLSFIRVAAFAITHGLLSFIFLGIANSIGVFGIIIIVLGNVIIIGLEGMIVSIQTIRLEYYEFFSKFFMDKGKKFIPFKIEKIIE